MSVGKADINDVLAKLRAKYVSELPDKLNEIEDLAMAISKGEDADDNMLELYRRVHSIKGSAGSYGVSVVSAVCHRFEDRINEDQEDVVEGDRPFIDDTFRFVDLLREAADLVRAGTVDYSTIEAKLAAFGKDLTAEDPVPVSVFLLDDTKTTAMLVRAAFKDEGVDLVSAESDLDALERLISERFDLAVCGLGVGRLGGLGLIAALKLSAGRSRDVTTVLLTTDPGSVSDTNPAPDYILDRGPEMLSALKDIVANVRAKKEQASS